MSRVSYATVLIILIISTTVCSEETPVNKMQDALLENNKGIEMLQVGNIEGAKGHFEKAIKLDEKNGEFYNNLGFCYFSLGDSKEAEKYYKKSISVDEKYFRSYYNYGVLLQKNKDFKSALEKYKLALKYNENYPEAMYNLALVSMMLGNKKEAIAGFEQFIEIAGEKYPGPANDAKQRIKELNK